MRVVSSFLTPYLKIWFPLLLIGEIVSELYMGYTDDYSIKWMAVAASLIALPLHRLTLGKIKKVSIDGDHIEISNFRNSCRIPIREISEVVEGEFLADLKVSLILKKPSRLGSKVSFIPRWNPKRVRPHPIVTEIKGMIGDSTPDT